MDRRAASIADSDPSVATRMFMCSSIDRCVHFQCATSCLELAPFPDSAEAGGLIMPSGGRSWGVIHTPESAWFRPQHHEQPREPSAPPEGPAEPRSATGVVGTSD